MTLEYVTASTKNFTSSLEPPSPTFFSYQYPVIFLFFFLNPRIYVSRSLCPTPSLSNNLSISSSESPNNFFNALLIVRADTGSLFSPSSFLFSSVSSFIIFNISAVFVGCASVPPSVFNISIYSFSLNLVMIYPYSI